MLIVMSFVYISHSSVMDDSIEEHKLLSQHGERARLKELAGDEWEEDEGGGRSGDAQSVVQLRETIKMERDQKVYYVHGYGICPCEYYHYRTILKSWCQYETVS